MAPSAPWACGSLTSPFLSSPVSLTRTPGEGQHVPDLHTGCRHPTLPLRTLPLLLPASGLLLPWLLAEPVGGRPHHGRAADTGGPARLGLRAPGVPARYLSLAFLPSILSAAPKVLRAPWATHPWLILLPLAILERPGSLRRGWEE